MYVRNCILMFIHQLIIPIALEVAPHNTVVTNTTYQSVPFRLQNACPDALVVSRLELALEIEVAP